MLSIKKVTYGAPLGGAPFLWMYLWSTPGWCAIVSLSPLYPFPPRPPRQIKSLAPSPPAPDPFPPRRRRPLSSAPRPHLQRSSTHHHRSSSTPHHRKPPPLPSIPLVRFELIRLRGDRGPLVVAATTVVVVVREDVHEDHRVWLLPFREPARAGVSRSRRHRHLLRSSAHISSPRPRRALLRPSPW